MKPIYVDNPEHSPQWWAELIVDNAEAAVQIRFGDKYDKNFRDSLVLNATYQIKRIMEWTK